MQVTATDTEGIEFIKIVTTRKSELPENQGDELIICFGWPVEYYAKDLMKHYPFQKPMCIDMGGLNHKGHQVSISAEQMDKVIEKLIIEPEILPFGDNKNEADAGK